MTYKNGLLERFTLDNPTKHDFLIDNWRAYNVVSSQADFIALINILEAHGESLENLRDVIEGDIFCGIFYNHPVENDRDAARVLLANNTFYTPETFPEYIRDIVDNCEFSHMTKEETAAYLHEVLNEGDGTTFITRTADGYVVSVFC